MQDLNSFNEIYQDIAENFGIDTAVKFHERYRGQQIAFPVNLLRKSYIFECIQNEYDGSNVKELARKYGYTERWLLHKLKKTG